MLATLVMTLVMAIGMGTGAAPMPEPIPVAIARLGVGSAPLPVLMGAGMLAHFAYGGLAGVVYGLAFARRRTPLTGLAWGLVLWGIMQVAVLPVLGWGFFGAEIALGVAGATLLLHLIYGAVLGYALRTDPGREEVR